MKEFLKAAGIRMIRTFCQSALAMIPAEVMITQVEWSTVFQTAALAAVVSLLMSVATGLPEVKDDSDTDN